ncbi:hypothetical protein DPMN_151287 [Dreissena polymorpha]|uniref:Uncharacterized protein n=1 Tax=Dreissena polymorpha TaxID=45954 RepID=A0A9D4FGV1_DREPO|nr:hypothetical protein DPMN_151287 [Dreissena polymorpha]
MAFTTRRRTSSNSRSTFSQVCDKKRKLHACDKDCKFQKPYTSEDIEKKLCTTDRRRLKNLKTAPPGIEPETSGMVDQSVTTRIPHHGILGYRKSQSVNNI